MSALQNAYRFVILRNKVMKDLSFLRFFKLSRKDPSLTLRMTRILQGALSLLAIQIWSLVLLIMPSSCRGSRTFLLAAVPLLLYLSLWRRQNLSAVHPAHLTCIRHSHHNKPWLEVSRFFTCLSFPLIALQLVLKIIPRSRLNGDFVLWKHDIKLCNQWIIRDFPDRVPSFRG